MKLERDQILPELRKRLGWVEGWLKGGQWHIEVRRQFAYIKPIDMHFIGINDMPDTAEMQERKEFVARLTIDYHTMLNDFDYIVENIERGMNAKYAEWVREIESR